MLLYRPFLDMLSSIIVQDMRDGISGLTRYAVTHYYKGMKTSTIGSRLSFLRQRAALSQNALAHKSGVNQGLISHIERGDVLRPSFATMVKLSEAMGVSLDDFVARGKRTTEKQ